MPKTASEIRNETSPTIERVMNYEQALEASRAASKEFRDAQLAYRARKIGDAEFLAAKAKHDAASKAFDEAYRSLTSGESS